MNKELLLQVRDTIVKNYDHFDMTTFVFTNRSNFSWEVDSVHLEALSKLQRGEAPCGTTACISGWTAALANKPVGNQLPDVLYKPSEGNLPLQLTSNQAHCLFYHEGWPNEFQEAYDEAETELERAQAAANYIDWFIECDGDPERIYIGNESKLEFLKHYRFEPGVNFATA